MQKNDAFQQKELERELYIINEKQKNDKCH